MERVVSIEKLQHDCPLCDKVHEVEKIKRIVSSTIKDCCVDHEETVFRCPQRNEEWYHGKMLDDSLQSMRDAYRVKQNLLTSKQIIEIRKKYNLSQKELSNLLGWGGVTISRYETKLIQDETYDGILRLAAQSPTFAFEKLVKHKELFTNDRFIEISTFLKRLIKTQGNIDLKRQVMLNYYVDYDTECDANGFKILDLNKLSDILAYFANYVHRLYKVKLMKLLWYSDVLFFNKYKRSMTGLVYQHMPLGALPIGYNEIIYLPTVRVDEGETENGTTYHIVPLSPPANPMFSLEEQDVLSRVASKFKEFNSREIIDYMHNEEVYKNTTDGEIILYSHASTIIDF
jgi:putative zinc finger/helix-turn-helix YgiT family protein